MNGGFPKTRRTAKGYGLGLRVSQNSLKNKGYLLRGPHNQDYSLLGYMLGSPILGDDQIATWYIIDDPR